MEFYKKMFQRKSEDSRSDFPKCLKIDNTKLRSVYDLKNNWGFTLNISTGHKIHGQEFWKHTYLTQYNYLMSIIIHACKLYKLSYYAVSGLTTNGNIHLHGVVGYDPTKKNDKGKSRQEYWKKTINKYFNSRFALKISHIRDKDIWHKYLKKNVKESFELLSKSSTKYKPIYVHKMEQFPVHKIKHTKRWLSSYHKMEALDDSLGLGTKFNKKHSAAHSHD